MARKKISNADILTALREMALFLEMDDVPWKPQAYEKAAYVVGALDRPLTEIFEEGGEKALDELPGIGKGIAHRLAELLSTGRMADLEALRAKMPIDALGLTAVGGIGAKTARALFDALGVRNVAELRAAAEQGRIHDVPRFGERSEKKILSAIAFHEEAGARRSLGLVLPLAEHLEASLRRVDGVERAAIAGSIRRRRDTIGDVDLLVVAQGGPDRILATLESMTEVRAVLAHGPTKIVVRLAAGLDADLRIVPRESFGAALVYFTGSKKHNVALRRIARKKRLKLNEYGLFRRDAVVAGRTEEEVYEALGLSWVPPEIREDAGEIELALEHRLPTLVQPSDVRGDLQVHTTWTDGTASVEEMARAAMRLGREYIVITDHTGDLRMTGGLRATALRAQLREIREIDRTLPGIRVLAGAEVNIRPDGSLDIDDGLLAELDVVGAAIHSRFDQPRAEMTSRIVRAVRNPQVDVLFHPTSRAIGQRKAVDFDFDAVLAACRETGTVLEIDAQPERLDLPDTFVRAAVEAGVRVAIDSDAHSVDELRFLDVYGVSVARRGWVTPASLINALPVERMLASLKGGRGDGPKEAARPRRARS